MSYKTCKNGKDKNGSFKITVKNVGIVALVVSAALTCFIWFSDRLNSKVDKDEFETIKSHAQTMEVKLASIETKIDFLIKSSKTN